MPLPPPTLIRVLTRVRFRVLMEPPLLTLIMLVGPDHVIAAANAIVPLKLLAVASDCRSMNPRRRNPGAHEDANAEIGVPPHLRTGRRGRSGDYDEGLCELALGRGSRLRLLCCLLCLTTVVHRRAEAGGAECERKLRTAALPSSALHHLRPLASTAVLFVLRRLLCCLLLLYDCGLGRD